MLVSSIARILEMGDKSGDLELCNQKLNDFVFKELEVQTHTKQKQVKHPKMNIHLHSNLHYCS
jgi:hypothetical protein